MTAVRRGIREEERLLLRSLAEHDPEYRAEYLDQIANISEVEDWNDGTHSITLVDGPHGVRVNAIAQDEDGSQIEIILFGDEAMLCILELFRSDGLPIKRYPEPSSLKDVWNKNGDPRPAGW